MPDEKKGIEAAREEHNAPPKDEDSGAEAGADETDEDDGAEDEGAEDEDPKAEVARLKKALKEANRDAARNRRKAKAAAGEGDDEDADSPAKLRQELYTRDAVDAIRDEYPHLTSKEARRAVRMLDSVHPNDLQDSIEELVEEFPSLFKEPEKPTRKRAPSRGPGGGEPRGSGRPSKGNLSPTSQAMLKQVRGR